MSNENIASVSGTINKDCKNCKHHNSDKIGCEHPKWQSCVVRDRDGFVIKLLKHNYR